MPVRSDCAPWLREVDEALPTIVIAARGADHSDILDVLITIDETTTLAPLGGRAFAVNPGVHVLRFEHAPSPSVVQTVVIREGEKDRLIEARFSAPVRPDTVPAVAAGASRSTLPYVVWGAAGISLGTSLLLALHARSERDALSCSPNCSEDQVTPIRNELRGADLVLAVGAVFVGLGAWLFLSGDTSPQSAAPAVSTATWHPLAVRDERTEYRCNIADSMIKEHSCRDVNAERARMAGCSDRGAPDAR